MAKIITVTPNTAIDFFIEVDSLSEQDNIQARNSLEFSCGKGVNVAKAVTSLDIPVTCLGFVGCQSLPAFDALNSSLLMTDFTLCQGKTRTNITVFASSENREIHIRTAGFNIAIEDCKTLLKKLENYIESGDIVVLSGSLPNGTPEHFYQTLINLCHSQSAIVFLDSSGSALLAGLSAKPYLIKPNQQELEAIAGKALPNEAAIVDAAHSLIDQGITWVYVSRGEKGVIIVSKNSVTSAYIDTLPYPVVSHIGCGDAMVAGLAVAILKGFELETIIKTGISCATANLFSLEPGQFDNTVQAELTHKVVITSIL